MRNPGGYAQLFMPKSDVVNFDGLRCEMVNEGTLEIDSFTCFHCNSIVHVPAKADVNFIGICRNCMRPICARCSNLPCTPWEKKIEQVEARDRALRSYGF